MKIIHVITAFGIGGAEKLLKNIVNKQVKEHDVYLVYFKDKNDLVDELDKKIHIKQIPFSRHIVTNLKKFYEQVQPDIIHTHLGHADLLGIWSARKTKAALFCTMHNIYFKKNYLDFFFFKLYTFLFLNAAKNTHVISISKAVEKHVVKKLKVPKERSHVLKNAISPKEIEKKNKLKDTIRLLFVGRLEKQKSVETLLKAIAILKNKQLKKEFKLTIVGDGSLRKELKLLSKKLKINHLVTFKGEQKDVDAYYSISDIFILPSIFEGFGIVIIEAIRAKVAVIASNIEGPAELIDNGKNGLLFPVKNEKILANKIELLIINDAKREELIDNGYKTFTKHDHIDTSVKKLNNLYLNVYNQKNT
ncbi:GalNAc-alpha-(1-_4)-GalNAc-alpha-(1-_3)-diNAcBac-PP-undecaprenol alpha-1,4-N-acetyl-D-galactosaminyltransferase [Polaribacter huanghezhanensis]|uniref:glycosyltransferase family 4 protein n=1 Tax=Polaribacter huanghezhanensis TaxID=1354726 RepID=UPI00264A4C7B|nr:glycosyltransferase family 4 protein [Polaribacter huanghezhanensis]WKD85554.1 GalNAc-alpha-(1->4)-GalNAc-alpha-(1->3)-diNAcBac-PP-undecaprenol alpha-1,4-N-acetyl-D-galactosaminyltransferase [Polaribacter huanghezhanensis]